MTTMMIIMMTILKMGRENRDIDNNNNNNKNSGIKRFPCPFPNEWDDNNKTTKKIEKLNSRKKWNVNNENNGNKGTKQREVSG